VLSIALLRSYNSLLRQKSCISISEQNIIHEGIPIYWHANAITPRFQPIIQELREKYQLPEVIPDDEPRTEIYLGDELIPLEDFT
jgi:hypothetical protein